VIVRPWSLCCAGEAGGVIQRLDGAPGEYGVGADGVFQGPSLFHDPGIQPVEVVELASQLRDERGALLFREVGRRHQRDGASLGRITQRGAVEIWTVQNDITRVCQK